MKRLVLVLLVAAILVPAASALDLGNFPLGSWFDANWDAVWEFTSGNIRILAPDGTEHFDFDKVGVQNWKIGAGADGPNISFDCEASGRSYKLSKPLTNTAVILEIKRPAEADYRVEMSKR